jgi:hypothetical protein
MKKTIFIALFITTHIGFLFLHIHKHMEFIRESFSKQKNEQLLTQTLQKKQAKENELYALRSKQEIKKEAREKLGLKPVSMTQLHRLSHET